MNGYRLIEIECRDRVFCVRLKHTRLEELEIHELGEELRSLSDRHGCRFLAMSLGPQTPYCLYSVFLSQLVSIRNAFLKLGGGFVLCEVGPQTLSAFSACKLQTEFVFLPDFAAAVRHFSA